MKYLLNIAVLMLFAGTYAQDKPVDKMQETKVKTVMMEKDGKMVESKVKVVTTKEQTVMTNPEQADQRDADRFLPPVKVSKTIMIDNDNDPFYEAETQLRYYSLDGLKYQFRNSENGFEIAVINGDEEVLLGSAVRSQINSYYFITIENMSGVGYFDEEGNLVVEYFNPESNSIIMKKFEDSAF